jgi:hypothetical protein
MNEAGESNKKSVIEVVEERFERRLTEEIGKLRTDMADLRANLIQWMFLFWIGQIGVLTGILFAFFRK